MLKPTWKLYENGKTVLILKKMFDHPGYLVTWDEEELK